MDVCRTCLKQTPSEDLMDLFDGGLLPYKIEIISGIQLDENDNLPSQACTRCVLNINLAFDFRMVVINSDRELQQLDGSYRDILIKSEVDDLLYEESEYKVFEFSSIEKTSSKDSVKTMEFGASDVSELELDIAKTSKPTRITINKLYQCTLCDFQTTKYKQLYQHKNVSHERTKKVVCSICGKSLLQANMRKHILSHDSRPANCEICGNVCKNAESLRSHMLYHKGVARICHICGKMYRHSSKYALHIRQHLAPKEKKHPCHLCAKSFTESDTLKKHIRSHTGERPFPCEFCKKGFSSPYALKTHRRQHTKERPFACSLCPMAFPQRVSLRTHIKSKHDIE